MELSYNNTKINTYIMKTDNNTGLSNGDFWCKTNFSIKNNDVCYHISRETLSYNEIKSAIDIIEKFLSCKINRKIIKFIKNYIIIRLYKINNMRIMEFDIMQALKHNGGYSKYTVIFNEEEARAYINNIKEIILKF